MEGIISSNSDLNSLGILNVECEASEIDNFHRCLDEMCSRVRELEEKVNVVEQLYTSCDSKQANFAKIGPTLKEKSKDKYLVGIDKQQDAMQRDREAAADKRMQELIHQFAMIFYQITQHKWAWPFRHPVDVVSLGLSDYYDVIEKPMDFETIQNKLDAKVGIGYKNVKEIYADVRLVFKNAMKYNDERDDAHVMARTLLKKFEEKWLSLLPKVVEEERRREEEEAEAQLTMKVAQEASHAHMARDISNELFEIDMHLEKLREMVVQKCRKLSAEDKRNLGISLTLLAPEDISRVLEIVSEDNPNFEATASEVDLDIDAQSELTLWRLKVFVLNALKAGGENCRRSSHGNLDISNEESTKKPTISTPTTTTSKNCLKRRRESCDALALSAAKKTAKIIDV